MSELLKFLNSRASCPECGSTDLQWASDVENNGGVQDGTISMRDVGSLFYLGCLECSETIKIVKGNEVAQILTKIQTKYD